jgi:uncharacterized membrane protein (GlpM family)
LGLEVTRVEFEPEGLKKSKAHEYVVRFVFGGLVTAATGLVAHRWGPVVGGLFLAFPAIVPASLTFVKSHGGRQSAIDDARGARLGSVALCGFAAVAWLLCGRTSLAVALVAALLVWSVVGGLLWWLVYGATPSPACSLGKSTASPSSAATRERDVTR